MTNEELLNHIRELKDNGEVRLVSILAVVRDDPVLYDLVIAIYEAGIKSVSKRELTIDQIVPRNPTHRKAWEMALLHLARNYGGDLAKFHVDNGDITILAEAMYEFLEESDDHGSTEANLAFWLKNL